MQAAGVSDHNGNMIGAWVTIKTEPGGFSLNELG